MKTASTYLHDLASLLTKSEKRYLRVQAGMGKKDYLELLDAILAQKTYDEARLVKENQGANFLKNLSVNKAYLYELILNTLTNFGQQSLEDKALARLSGAKVLISRGLFRAAAKELQKGKKIVFKHEFHALQILFSQVEKQLLARQPTKQQNLEAVELLCQAELHCLEQLQNTNTYWQLAQRIAQFQMRFQRVQNEEQKRELEALAQLPAFKDLAKATNFKSKTYYYQLNATYQFILGDVEKAYQINRQFLELLDANPHFLVLYGERYLATLNNMLIDSLISRRYDALEEGMHRLALAPKRPEFKSIKNIEARVFRQRYLLLLNWSLSQNDFAKALQWIPEIEAGLEQYGKKIARHHRITFYYLTAYLLFQNQQYYRALHWNSLLINDPKEDVVKEIFYFARVLNLLIHYELGNYDLLEALLQSTPKYLKARRPTYATEKALFRFLHQLLKPLSQKEKQDLEEGFNQQLLTLFQDPAEKRVFNYLDLRYWRKADYAN